MESSIQKPQLMLVPTLPVLSYTAADWLHSHNSLAIKQFLEMKISEEVTFSNIPIETYMGVDSVSVLSFFLLCPQPILKHPQQNDLMAMLVSICRYISFH